MTYRVELSDEAIEDLRRLEDHLIELALEHGDVDLPRRAMQALREEMRVLERNPFTCRKVRDNAYERELIVPFGSTGYVAFFRILGEGLVMVGAIRHQREDDYR